MVPLSLFGGGRSRIGRSSNDLNEIERRTRASFRLDARRDPEGFSFVDGAQRMSAAELWAGGGAADSGTSTATGGRRGRPATAAGGGATLSGR